MIKISELLPDEVEILKENFHPFLVELKTIINNSKLFIDKTNENPWNSPNYHSHTSIKNRNTGLLIQCEKNFSSLKFHISTKKRKNGSEEILSDNENLDLFDYDMFLYYPVFLKEGKSYDFIENGDYDNYLKKLDQRIFNISSIELDFLHLVNKKISDLLSSVRQEQESKKNEFEKKQDSLDKKKINLISILDKDGNGEVDLVDDENYNKILVNNQKNIIEIDKNYIQKFVKISIYLKTKRSNIQKIFDSIKKTKNDTELNELVNLLKNQIHTYDLLVFHSISMITSLVDSDLITFYQIYECFDQLGVFNSNWENEVSDKLTNIGNGIKDLMYSIYQMESKIVNSIGKLTYITQSSYNNLNLSINSQLRNINSSLDYSNYMTKIQNYKMFNIIT